MKEKEILKLKGYKRIICGVIVLLLVDIIWVLSAELSEYIFHDAEFNKPFFTTYLKTSLFGVYMIGFLFIRRWQYQCSDLAAKNNTNTKKLLKEVQRVTQVKSFKNNGLTVPESVSRASTPIQNDEHFTEQQFENVTDDESSIGDNDKKVSFSSVREVRSLSRTYGEAQVLARMSQSSVDALQNMLMEITQYYPFLATIKLSLYVCILWMVATLMYQEALARTSAAVTNILSSSSSIFTLLLAAVFPSSVTDKITLSKFLAVLISFGGIFLICWTDPSRKETTLNLGELYSILGAIFYACYLVLIKRSVKESEKLDMALFFGFIGFFGLLIFWPGFFILHYTKQETFELPPNKLTWGFLLLNGIVGTVVSEMLWLYGCFLTSSLMATLSLGLVIPLSMIWDMFFNRIHFSWLFFVGLIPVLFSFVSVSILTHYAEWDPVKILILRAISPCKKENHKYDESKALLREEEIEPSANNGSINSSIEE